MADLVRVKHSITKAEFTTAREAAEADKELNIIDKPAVYEVGHRAGMPLPPKPYEPITDKVAATKAPTATPKTKEA